MESHPSLPARDQVVAGRVVVKVGPHVHLRERARRKVKVERGRELLLLQTTLASEQSRDWLRLLANQTGHPKAVTML